jgi:hypothetical protein
MMQEPHRPGRVEAAVAPQVYRKTRALFEYFGRTGLTVTGPVTGQRYRFDGPGAQVPVDLRDRRSLLVVPHLRELA